MKNKYTEDKAPLVMPEITEKLVEWINSFNNGKRSVMNLLYTDNALLFSGHDEALQGPDIIRMFYAEMSDSCRIVDYIIDCRVKLNENPDKIYEIGHLLMATGERFQYFILWTLLSGRWFHEMDAIAKCDINLSDNPGIHTARELWVKLANVHNALALAKEVYTENFVYLNRGQIYTGYENLAEAYSYMNQADFKVNLVPDISIIVQPDLAYEIGTWTSNGTGRYIILWELQSGSWKVRFDSNW